MLWAEEPQDEEAIVPEEGQERHLDEVGGNGQEGARQQVGGGVPGVGGDEAEEDLEEEEEQDGKRNCKGREVPG